MKKITTILILLCTLLSLHAQGDPHSLRLMGIALEGPVDSVRQQLSNNGFKEWGQSDDGEDFYYRGNFYGIRAKLLVTTASDTNLVSSAYVTIGPYSTEAMLTKNLQYFLYKLQKEHGEFSKRDDSYFYLDDFGTGYSTMTMLKNMPVGEVKVDKGFIDEIENENAQIILENIIHMLKALNKTIIVEGVEHLVQQQFLLNHGCCYAQGFLYHKPMPISDYEALLDR